MLSLRDLASARREIVLLIAMASLVDAQHCPSGEYITALQRVILELHECPSRHVETVWVHETYLGNTLWHGNVEIFDVDHPRTRRCYAWTQPAHPGKNVRLFAVLGTSAIKTPLDAVKFVHMVTTAPLINEFSKLAGRPGKSS